MSDFVGEVFLWIKNTYESDCYSIYGTNLLLAYDFFSLLRRILIEFTLLILSFCLADAPVYLSFPHFYRAEKELLDSVEGLNPEEEKHGSYFKIQPVSFRKLCDLSFYDNN